MNNPNGPIPIITTDSILSRITKVVAESRAPASSASGGYGRSSGGRASKSSGYMDNLVVKEATAGEGPTMRRYMPRARGSASPIRKRTSHIFITVTDAT